MTTNPKLYNPQNIELAAYYGVQSTLVDQAIDTALENAAQEDGWPGIPWGLNPAIWNRIGSDVERWLESYIDTMGREAA